MSEELFDLEIKKSFEEEFDAQDIFVSEDLIARTMAAIKSQENETANSAQEENIDSNKDNIISVTDNVIQNSSNTTEKVVDITAPTARKKSYKWVSGIAAALVIGVVGLLIYKVGMGGIKSNSDYAAANYSNNAENSYATEKYMDEPKSVPESVKEDTVASAASDRAQSEEYDMAVTCAPASESYSDVNYFSNESKTNDAAGYADEYEVSLTPEDSTAKNDADDSGKTSDNTLDINDGKLDSGETITKELMAYIDGIVTELDLTENKELLYTEENMKMIYATSAYRELMDYSKNMENEEFTKILNGMYESKKGTAYEINILYLLLKDMK